MVVRVGETTVWVTLVAVSRDYIIGVIEAPELLEVHIYCDTGSLTHRFIPVR